MFMSVVVVDEIVVGISSVLGSIDSDGTNSVASVVGIVCSC